MLLFSGGIEETAGRGGWGREEMAGRGGWGRDETAGRGGDGREGRVGGGGRRQLPPYLLMFLCIKAQCLPIGHNSTIMILESCSLESQPPLRVVFQHTLDVSFTDSPLLHLWHDVLQNVGEAVTTILHLRQC